MDIPWLQRHCLVYMGFVHCGSTFQMPTHYGTKLFMSCLVCGSTKQLLFVCQLGLRLLLMYNIRNLILVGLDSSIYAVYIVLIFFDL